MEYTRKCKTAQTLKVGTGLCSIVNKLLRIIPRICRLHCELYLSSAQSFQQNRSLW